MPNQRSRIRFWMMAVVVAGVATAAGLAAGRPATETATPFTPRDAAYAPATTPDDLIEVFAENFDDGDPHGWHAVDLTAQPNYWHQTTWDNGDGARGVMWCGTTFDNPSADGYGNNWIDYLYKDVTLPAGSVFMDYTMQYDMENGWDYLYVEISADGGQSWTLLSSYTGSTYLAYLVLTNDLSAWAGQSVRVRFRFQSDVSVSDEDGLIDTSGAVHIDSISITGVGMDDFEVDQGDWANPPYGIGGGPDHPDLTYRLVEVPFCTPTDECTEQRWTWVGYVEEEPHEFPISPDGNIMMGIESPVLDIPTVPPGGMLCSLQFLVHVELPFEGSLFYRFAVACPPVDEGGMWRDFNELYYGTVGDFYLFSRSISSLLTPGAEHLQIRLYAEEAPWFTGYPQPESRSPSPMFDEVALLVDSAVATFMQGVTLAQEDGDAVLRWTTQVTSDCDGFHVYRAAGQAGSFVRLTTAPVTAATGGDGGVTQQYEFRDTSVLPGVAYAYELAAVFPGEEVRFGPYYLEIPTRSWLAQNSPNPFNPATTIRFSLAQDSQVKLTIFDPRGLAVRHLVDQEQLAGPHAVQWDGRDDTGRALGSGVYFYRLDTESQSVMRKMVLVK